MIRRLFLLFMLGMSSPALGFEQVPQTVGDTLDWHTYTNNRYGYEIRHPDGFDLWPTGPEGERDGATLRIARKEYAAPAPVLDIDVRYGEAHPEPAPAASPGMDVAIVDHRINGVDARQITYRWESNGEIAFLEVHRSGVLFRFQAGVDFFDIRDTIWWEIISTFRFLDERRMVRVTTLASGTFDVNLTPQANDNGDGAIPGRLIIDKQFHGDLEATSQGEMLTALTGVEGSAGYVAIEQVSGTLHGRRGTFVLQHSGTMTRGAPQLTVTVVPDSGTDQLVGLAGTMVIHIAGEEHSYEFEYTLADVP
ncbi:MAG: DUF3224 domain-containing protein [Gemmatimonadota bacterium]